MRGAALRGDDCQHARTAAHIEPRAARDPEVEHRARHEPCRGMVARAERHLGHHDHLRLARGSRLVERRADAQAAFDIDGREITLPQCVPVLRLDGDIASADAVARQQAVDLLLAVGQPLLRDICLQHAVAGLETLEREIGQFGGQNPGQFFVGTRDIERDVIHIM